MNLEFSKKKTYRQQFRHNQKGFLCPRVNFNVLQFLRAQILKASAKKTDKVIVIFG